jgi:hypothetical protein
MDLEPVCASAFHKLIVTIREEKFGFNTVFSESFGDSQTSK